MTVLSLLALIIEKIGMPVGVQLTIGPGILIRHRREQ